MEYLIEAAPVVVAIILFFVGYFFGSVIIEKLCKGGKKGGD